MAGSILSGYGTARLSNIGMSGSRSLIRLRTTIPCSDWYCMPITRAAPETGGENNTIAALRGRPPQLRSGIYEKNNCSPANVR